MIADTVATFVTASQAQGASPEVIDVAHSQHGLNTLDHTDESRRPVCQALSWMSRPPLLPSVSGQSAGAGVGNSFRGEGGTVGVRPPRRCPGSAHSRPVRLPEPETRTESRW